MHNAVKVRGVPTQTLPSGRTSTTPPKPVRILNPSDEATLVSYISDVSTCGYGYSRMQLGMLVSETAYFLKQKSDNVVVSEDWLQHFLARWPELDVTEADSSSVAMTREIIDNYYQELLRILQKYDLLDKPDRIFNVHDTVVTTKQRVFKVADRTEIAATCCRRIQSVEPPESSEVTVISCMNGAGHVLPPYVVFNGKRMTKDLLTEGLPGTAGTMAYNGLSNSRVFQRFLKDHFQSIVLCSTDHPVLLLYNGHRPYVNMPLIDWAEKQNMILYLRPPHTSQPQDAGAFRPLKVAYESQCDKFLTENIGRIVTRYDICDIVGKAYQQVMTQEVIIPTFKAMGAVPYDPTVVTDDCLVDGRHYERVNPGEVFVVVN